MSRKEVLRLCHPFKNPIVENTSISGWGGPVMTKSLTSNSGSFNGRPAEFQPRRNKGLGGGRLSMPAMGITICKFVAHCRHASDVVYDIVYTVIDWSWETKIDSSSMGPRTATAAAKPVP